MEHEQIHSVIEANNAAVAAGDIEAVLATFEPSGALAGQPGLVTDGPAALRGAFEGFMGMKPQITITGQEIVQAGDIALHSTTWDMTGAAPDGSEIAQSGFSVVVLRRQDDGRWLIAIDNPFGDHLVRQH